MMTKKSKVWLFVTAITLLLMLLTLTYPGLLMIQLLSSVSKDRCERSHPVFASFISSCHKRYPNFGVTRENANDQLSGKCLLLMATDRGRYDIFEALLKAGADPKKCGENYADHFFAYWVLKSGDSKFLDRFDELGIEASNPQALLFRSAEQRKPAGIDYAVARGADPNKVNGKESLPIRNALVADAMGLATIKALISAGADPNLPAPYDGLSAIQKVCNAIRLEQDPFYEERRRKLLTALGTTESVCTN